MRHHTHTCSMSRSALVAGRVCSRRAPVASASPLARRGGAVIIVVLALLSLMVFLGIFFFEFVQEEQMAAQNYATNPYDEVINPDEFFNEADKQLIIGPDSNRTLSALNAGDDFNTTAPAGVTDGLPGTPQSMLAHVIGRMRPTGSGTPPSVGMQPSDVLPHNGRGISVVYLDNDSDGFYGPGDYALFDMDGDGVFDATLPSEDTNGDGTLDPGEDVIIANGILDPAFALNYSRPAQSDPAFDAFAQPLPANALRPFQPDVEYTYPDTNTLFLASDRIDPFTGYRILVPSFVRPDLFPVERNTGFDDVYIDPNTKRLVMRPHAEHYYPDSTPAMLTDNTPRFLFNGTFAQSGDRDRYIPPFPFQVDVDQDGNFNEMGPYSYDSSATGVDRMVRNYDLDVDLNGDGEPDGIWMDLGLDMIDMADGRQFVPLFSFYILDADSLININAHGNLQEGYYSGAVAYNAAPFSVSNTGAGPSEVNPIRALTGNPSDFTIPNELQFVQKEHAFVFRFPAGTAQSQAAMANMEMSFMLGGRPLSRSGSPQTGRHGDESYVGAIPPVSPTNLFPRAGYTGPMGFDDDFDNTPDGTRYQGGGQRLPTAGLYDPRSGSASVVIPYASHPIAPQGTGSGAFSATGRTLVNGVVGSPVVWPHYQSGWEAPQTTATSLAGRVLPVQSPYPYGGAVFTNGTTTMIDEEDETRLASPDRRSDDIFLPDENLAMQVSKSDYQRVGGTSRLKTLAPFNFDYDRFSSIIRQRITTDSWDFSELTFVPNRFTAGSRTETSQWGTTSGRWFFPPDFRFAGTTLFLGNDPIRPELRALLASEDTGFVNYTGTARRESFNVNTTTGIPTPAYLPAALSLWRQPLNLNKLLVGFDNTGYPVFRDLMPHPDMVALEYEQPGTGANLMPAITIPAMIHDHTAPPALPFSNISAAPTTEADRATTATAMEWWARYDRQRMARDVYTLLYLVGAPNDVDPSTPTVDSPTTTAYPQSEKVREMAQFAVNYVDALDRDDVITKFEYDSNLSNGWSWSSGGSESFVVYGVERASLSFSEVQFVQTKPQASDYSSTMHKDNNDVHQFLHMELRNGSPFTVNLAEGWRISRVVSGTGTRDISVEFKTRGTFGAAGATIKQVPAGENFLIGTHDGTVQNGSSLISTSDIFADSSGGGELESILPASTMTLTNNLQSPVPQTDLDLGGGAEAVTRGDNQYYHPPAAPTAPSTYAVTNTKLVETLLSPAVPAQVQFDLVLERRQNLNGIEPTVNVDVSSSMGEWIEVDRFHVNSDDMDTSTTFGQFDPTANTQAAVALALLPLNSVERRQSFDPVQVAHTNVAAPGFSHSMSAVVATKHAANTALGVIGLTQFTLWQPHFDRDFTSAYELLSVPLYGNWPLTELVAGLHTGTTASVPVGTFLPNTFYKEIHGGTQFNLAPGSNSGASGRMTGDFTAGMRFNFPNGIPGRPYQGWNRFNYQNAWYRLFDFVSVPRRADQQSEEILSGGSHVAGSTKPVFRVPGKINLNTLRDETILAALLDDETHLAYGTNYPTGDNLTAGRNWFLELLQSVDGTDFFANQAGVPQMALPNSIVSRPFRGTSKLDPYSTPNIDDGVESGLLRSSTRRNGVNLAARPDGSLAPYATPGLTPPVNFTSTGLWPGAPTHDTSAINWQGLFDAGDLSTSTGIDHHTRSRILAKIANNSTSKSHVFFVWTAVGYFEAHRSAASGNVQIGARMSDIPVHRRFSVVDMSRLDEAYDTNSNTFDESKFVIFQKRLR